MSRKTTRKKSTPMGNKGRNSNLTWIVAGAGIVFIGVIVLTGSLSAKNPNPNTAPPNGKFTYMSNIKPILEQSCTGCHSSTGMRPDIPLTGYENVTALVKPGDANSSRLFQAINGGKMTGRLGPQETETIKNWINQGAAEK